MAAEALAGEGAGVGGGYMSLEGEVSFTGILRFTQRCS